MDLPPELLSEILLHLRSSIAHDQQTDAPPLSGTGLQLTFVSSLFHHFLHPALVARQHTILTDACVISKLRLEGRLPEVDNLNPGGPGAGRVQRAEQVSAFIKTALESNGNTPLDSPELEERDPITIRFTLPLPSPSSSLSDADTDLIWSLTALLARPALARRLHTFRLLVSSVSSPAQRFQSSRATDSTEVPKSREERWWCTAVTKLLSLLIHTPFPVLDTIELVALGDPSTNTLPLRLNGPPRKGPSLAKPRDSPAAADTGGSNTVPSTGITLTLPRLTLLPRALRSCLHTALSSLPSTNITQLHLHLGSSLSCDKDKDDWSLLPRSWTFPGTTHLTLTVQNVGGEGQGEGEERLAQSLGAFLLARPHIREVVVVNSAAPASASTSSSLSSRTQPMPPSPLLEERRTQGLAIPIPLTHLTAPAHTVLSLLSYTAPSLSCAFAYYSFPSLESLTVDARVPSRHCAHAAFDKSNSDADADTKGTLQALWSIFTLLPTPGLTPSLRALTLLLPPSPHTESWLHSAASGPTLRGSSSSSSSNLKHSLHTSIQALTHLTSLHLSIAKRVSLHPPNFRSHDAPSSLSSLSKREGALVSSTSVAAFVSSFPALERLTLSGGIHFPPPPATPPPPPTTTPCPGGSQASSHMTTTPTAWTAALLRRTLWRTAPPSLQLVEIRTDHDPLEVEVHTRAEWALDTPIADDRRCPPLPSLPNEGLEFELDSEEEEEEGGDGGRRRRMRPGLRLFPDANTPHRRTCMYDALRRSELRAESSGGSGSGNA